MAGEGHLELTVDAERPPALPLSSDHADADVGREAEVICHDVYRDRLLKTSGADGDAVLPLADTYSTPLIWQELVLKGIHPVKVVIIEALLWMEMPLSKNEITQLIDDKTQYYLSLVSYHVETLVTCGILREAGSRTTRGATETYYFFSRQLSAICQ